MKKLRKRRWWSCTMTMKKLRVWKVRRNDANAPFNPLPNRHLSHITCQELYHEGYVPSSRFLKFKLRMVCTILISDMSAYDLYAPPPKYLKSRDAGSHATEFFRVIYVMSFIISTIPRSHAQVTSPLQSVLWPLVSFLAQDAIPNDNVYTP